MELSVISHVETANPLLGFEPDLFISASSFESRATVIARMLGESPARKVVFAYRENTKEFSRPENDRYFTENKFSIFTYSQSDIPDFHPVIGSPEKRNLKILIDISCMPRRWYHGLFSYLHSGIHGMDKVELRVLYIPSEFDSHPRDSRIKTMDSVCIDRGTITDGKKTALFLGLSQDPLNAIRVVEQIKPDSLYLFYSDPASDKRYIEKVFINNHPLIDSISIRNLIAYPGNNGQQIYQLLSDLALMLRLDHRLIAVPNGPKIFGLVTMALQMSYPDIQICNPDIRYKKLTDKKACGVPVALDLVFESE